MERVFPNPQGFKYAVCLLIALLAIAGQRSPAQAQQLRAPEPLTHADDGAAVSSVDANQLLQQSIARVESERSIAANVRQLINIYGRRLVGSGTYRQMNTGRDILTRMELKVPMGDTISSQLQICDGRFLWTYRALPGEAPELGIETTLTRVDLDKVQRQLGAPSIGQGSGGLAGMLRRAQVHYEFGRAQLGELYGVAVWRFDGRWMGRHSRDPLDEGHDPPLHFPSEVSLAIGVEDLFPYRIEYMRAAGRESERSILVTSASSRSLMALEFFEVQTGLTIDPQMFYFQPADVEVHDVTQAHIRNQK